jgi:ribosomal protein L2
MAIVKTKPTSAGRRFVVKIVDRELHKGGPYEPLVEKKSKTGGRNNKGRITTRHRGGGHKQRYRKIDFKRNKTGVTAQVERVQVANVKGKRKRTGMRQGKRKDWRKAYVRLKEGHDIDFTGGA